MDGSEGWIPDWVIRLAELVLSASGFLLTGIAGLLYRNYREHIAMLLRHEQELRAADKEFGLQRTHCEIAGKGPIGESLVKVIDELRAENQLLHRRISRPQKQHAELKDAIIEMRTDIKWMRQRFEERDNDSKDR